MEASKLSPIARGAFAACIVLPLLALGTVVLRVKARWMSQAKLRSDDHTMIIALVIAMGTCAILAYALFIGAAMGPPEAITGNSVVLTYELDIIIEQLYGVAEALTKISILLFYRRIFSTGLFPKVANFSIGLISIWALLFLLLFVFPVWPISTSWIPNQPSHQNYDWKTVLLWHSISNIGLDLYVLCLPLPIVRTLYMSRGRKAAVTGVLGLGSFCVIASCIRLKYVVGVQSEDVQTAGTGADAVSEAALWSVIEPCSSIIAGCLPTLGPLVKGTKVANWVEIKMRQIFPASGKVNFVGDTFIENSSTGSSRWLRKVSGDSDWHAYWPRRKGTEGSGRCSIGTERTDSTAMESREVWHTRQMV